jgi:hypothetical protein
MPFGIFATELVAMGVVILNWNLICATPIVAKSVYKI